MGFQESDHCSIYKTQEGAPYVTLTEIMNDASTFLIVLVGSYDNTLITYLAQPSKNTSTG